MARVICPFCLKPHDFRVSRECPEHNEVVPDAYIKEYDKAPPMWLATVGFSQHGKTTYLAALTLMLENMPVVLDNVYHRFLDQYTMDTVRSIRHEAQHGKMPASNPVRVSRPQFLSMYNLPESGSRCLVMYDVAGEVFNSLDGVSTYLPSIRQVSTTWFLVSLPDLEDDTEGKTITDLFQVYLSGMESRHMDLKGRNLIVVYTKADKAVFPATVKRYLLEDPFQTLTCVNLEIPDSLIFSFSDYVEEMRDISDQLEAYTRRRVRGGAAFIAMVKAQGMNLVFSLTSALGDAPDSKTGRLEVDARRYRVLDPFLWAVALEAPTSNRLLGLILDVTSQDGSLYIGDALFELWDRLSEHGTVTTFSLGQKVARSHPGQTPPALSSMTSNPPRLIGPILESADPETLFIVFAGRPILDLADFARTPWRNKVLLVGPDDQHQGWPNSITYRSSDAPSMLVDTLLRLQNQE